MYKNENKEEGLNNLFNFLDEQMKKLEEITYNNEKDNFDFELEILLSDNGIKL
ncbi:hypothetical protein Phi19:1_gp048 [Cellulophaga phage phi19:1]|uniref:Uncharacterized protein n=1 Tax=Cellulophaga phage phi19:1 TaxID=1327970 RepID=R9ZZF3_9CAUD|nr:hypothetical protein Phi19:1_gp048 [Cellulophaga phage phi19:1]AGO47338.1 hypothetical protein Phi19:1_gp048 [Cellulophaga phage phi19:1]